MCTYILVGDKNKFQQYEMRSSHSTFFSYYPPVLGQEQRKEKKTKPLPVSLIRYLGDGDL